MSRYGFFAMIMERQGRRPSFAGRGQDGDSQYRGDFPYVIRTRKQRDDQVTVGDMIGKESQVRPKENLPFLSVSCRTVVPSYTLGQLYIELSLGHPYCRQCSPHGRMHWRPYLLMACEERTHIGAAQKPPGRAPTDQATSTR